MPKLFARRASARRPGVNRAGTLSVPGLVDLHPPRASFAFMEVEKGLFLIEIINVVFVNFLDATKAWRSWREGRWVGEDLTCSISLRFDPDPRRDRCLRESLKRVPLASIPEGILDG